MGFVATRSQMVQAVRNIINAYSHGAIRALAQDPPQNSLDARVSGPVRVDYRLYHRTLNGRPGVILTVTDRGTSGLDGPTLTDADLDERARVQGVQGLQKGENWAAWEAMNYTKVDEDSLGSRGQGKAAFLFHSEHMVDGVERMLILYDTLLADGGEYRLGARCASPADVRFEPPYVGDQARSIITGEWAYEDLGYHLDLRLPLLEDPGTRIIVPFASQEVIDAVSSGEFARWLQRQWWRAIQVGELSITVGWEGEDPTVIEVPRWWDREWADEGSIAYFEKEGLPVAGDRYMIKRIVLLHDDALVEDEIYGGVPEWAGVQLLRRRQWIETLGARQEYSDLIPAAKVPGFRGFVEFDRSLDQRLREHDIERPQHDGFKRTTGLVREIVGQVREAVREFAQLQGWQESDEPDSPGYDGANEVLEELMELFMADGSAPDPILDWGSTMSLTYPTPGTTRVEFGEVLQAIASTVTYAPPDRRLDVRARLWLLDPSGESLQLAERTRRGDSSGRATVEFDDLEVDHKGLGGFFGPDGRYRLRVEWIHEGRRVAVSERPLLLRIEPPEQPTRAVSVLLSARNEGTGGSSVDYGERVSISASAVNRQSDATPFKFTASLGDRLILDDEAVVVPGTPKGGSEVVTRQRTLLVLEGQPDVDPGEPWVVLAPGRHQVLLDATVLGHQPMHATVSIWVGDDERDPGQRLPFEIEPWEEDAFTHPQWQLDPPANRGGVWKLRYDRRHPSYLAAEAADERRRGRVPRLYGVDLFLRDVICHGLVEKAYRDFRDGGDQSGIALLVADHARSGEPLWEFYQAQVRQLEDATDAIEYSDVQRRVVSAMVRLAQGV